jgi:hypothetical protein
MSRFFALWQCEIKRTLRVAAVSILAAASALSANAAPGDPDTTFQISGRVHTVINGSVTYQTFGTGEASGQRRSHCNPTGK